MIRLTQRHVLFRGGKGAGEGPFLASLGLWNLTLMPEKGAE